MNDKDIIKQLDSQIPQPYRTYTEYAVIIGNKPCFAHQPGVRGCWRIDFLDNNGYTVLVRINQKGRVVDEGIIEINTKKNVAEFIKKHKQMRGVE